MINTLKLVWLFSCAETKGQMVMSPGSNLEPSKHPHTNTYAQVEKRTERVLKEHKPVLVCIIVKPWENHFLQTYSLIALRDHRFLTSHNKHISTYPHTEARKHTYTQGHTQKHIHCVASQFCLTASGP